MAQILAAEAAIGNAIRETIEPGIDDWVVHKADPFFMDVFTTERGVIQRDIGRGYVHRRVYQDGVSGIAWATDALGDSEANILDTSVGYTASAPYPGLDEWRDARTFQRTIGLTKIIGNLILPLDVLRASALSAAVGDIVASRIESEAKRIAHMRTNWVYADSDNSLGTVASVTSGGGTGVSVAVITLDRVRARQLPGGMHLEIWKSDLTERRHGKDATLTSSQAFLVVVQYDTRTETLKLSLLNSKLWDSQVAVGDKIFMQNPSSDVGTDMSSTNRMKAPMGIFDQLKETGTIWNEAGQDGIALDDRPNFASMVEDVGNVFLTEDKLHSAFGQFDDRLGDLTELDTALTSNGVMVGLLNNQSGSETRERSNFTRRAKMGFTVFSFTYGGREVDIKVSRTIPKGEFIAMKTADGNLKEFVPPGLVGEREDGSKIPGVQFQAPELGYSSIFAPLFTSSGAHTNFKQAMFVQYTQLAYDKPMGLRLHNIREDLSS